MKLEKEIIQSAKFISEYHKLAVNIMFTSGWLMRRHAEQLKPYGITPHQFNILRILRGQHPTPVTINTLIERMIDKSSNASRLVDRLSEKGLVKRMVSDRDKRSVPVSITKQGLEVLKEIDQHLEILEQGFRVITEKEAKEMNRLLDRLRDQ